MKAFFFQSSIVWRNIWEVLKLSLSVTKPDFLQLACSLPLFCIAEIICVSNQGFEFAFTFSFLIGATESIAPINLFIKSEYAGFTQIDFKHSGEWIFQFLNDRTSILLNLWPFRFNVFLVQNITEWSEKPKSITPDWLTLWEKFVFTSSIRVSILLVILVGEVIVYSGERKKKNSKHLFVRGGIPF